MSFLISTCMTTLKNRRVPQKLMWITEGPEGWCHSPGKSLSLGWSLSDPHFHHSEELHTLLQKQQSLVTNVLGKHWQACFSVSIKHSVLSQNWKWVLRSNHNALPIQDMFAVSDSRGLAGCCCESPTPPPISLDEWKFKLPWLIQNEQPPGWWKTMMFSIIVSSQKHPDWPTCGHPSDPAPQQDSGWIYSHCRKPGFR